MLASSVNGCGAALDQHNDHDTQIGNNFKFLPIGKPLDTDPGTLDPRALTAVTFTVRI